MSLQPAWRPAWSRARGSGPTTGRKEVNGAVGSGRLIPQVRTHFRESRVEASRGWMTRLGVKRSRICVLKSHRAIVRFETSQKATSPSRRKRASPSPGTN